MPGWLIVLLIAVILFMIVAFLFKRLIKLAFVLLAIYVLFHIGYVWSTNEAADKLQLSQWLSPKAEEQMKDIYSVVDSKRAEHQVVDVNLIGQQMDESIQKSKEKVASIDKEAIKESWRVIFETLTSEEAEQYIQATKDVWSGIFTEKEMKEIAGTE